MNYTEFAEKMLLALYQENELNSNENVDFGTLATAYGFPENTKWIERLTEEWSADRLVDVQTHVGSPLGWRLEISGRGMRRIEQAYGGKDGVGEVLPRTNVPPPNAITTEDGRPLTTESGDYIVLEQPFADKTPSIASEAWTGIEQRLARNPAVVESIKQRMVELDREVENLKLTNNERAKVKAITEALVRLVESPEPEWKAIFQLLNSPAFTAALNLATLAQLTLSIILGGN